MRCVGLPPLDALHCIHNVKIILWKLIVLRFVVELDGAEQMFYMAVCNSYSHEFQEGDQITCFCWTVFQVEIDTEEEPSTNP